MKCVKECKKTETACSNKECRHWLEYPSDLNCSIISADLNGPMTLEEVSKRLGLSLVRIKQIEEVALQKLRKRDNGLDRELLHE
jgi:DNA-directed RNA polymerase sigma subunit (sigma70/sigma32)